jgi:hypothetical protein
VPSALKVSVAVRQVTRPARLESIAVINVQSIVEPRGGGRRRVGRRGRDRLRHRCRNCSENEVLPAAPPTATLRVQARAPGTHRG